ncbi:MAG: hypothetical protein AAFN65_03825 [Bacteroidota bacterium]
MTVDQLYYFIYTAAFFSLVPALSAIWCWSSFNPTQRLLGVLVIIAALTEIAAIGIIKILGQSNILLVHIFTVIELVLLIQIYRLEHVLSKSISFLITFLFFVLALVGAFTWDDVAQFKPNTVSRSTSSLLLVFFALRYFFQQSSNIDLTQRHHKDFLANSPMFWINVAVLVYFPASLFIFLFSQWFVVAGGKYGLIIYAVHAFLLIIKSLLFTISIWKKAPKSPAYSS